MELVAKHRKQGWDRSFLGDSWWGWLETRHMRTNNLFYQAAVQEWDNTIVGSIAVEELSPSGWVSQLYWEGTGEIPALGLAARRTDVGDEAESSFLFTFQPWAKQQAVFSPQPISVKNHDQGEFKYYFLKEGYETRELSLEGGKERVTDFPPLYGHVQVLTMLARRWTTCKPQTSWAVINSFINIITCHKVSRNTKRPCLPRFWGEENLVFLRFKKKTKNRHINFLIRGQRFPLGNYCHGKGIVPHLGDGNIMGFVYITGGETFSSLTCPSSGDGHTVGHSFT